jgi:hypothetical protein
MANDPTAIIHAIHAGVARDSGDGEPVVPIPGINSQDRWSPVCAALFMPYMKRYNAFGKPSHACSNRPQQQGSKPLRTRRRGRDRLCKLSPEAVGGDHHPHRDPARASRPRVKGSLELIRADNLKVVAGCGFVVDYLDKHPEYAGLVA